MHHPQFDLKYEDVIVLNETLNITFEDVIDVVITARFREPTDCGHWKIIIYVKLDKCHCFMFIEKENASTCRWNILTEIGKGCQSQRLPHNTLKVSDWPWVYRLLIGQKSEYVCQLRDVTYSVTFSGISSIFSFIKTSLRNREGKLIDEFCGQFWDEGETST